MDIGEKVSAFLEAEGISQAAFASSIGWSETTVSDMSRGKKDKIVMKIHNLVKRMGCDLDFLVDKTKNWPPAKKAKNSVVLTEEEMKILGYARDLGYQTAMARLLNLPGQRVPLDSPDQSSNTVGRKRSGS